MLVIYNNYKPPRPALRTVHCTSCFSELGITPADVRQKNGVNVVLCPCCKQDFHILTEAETVAAHYGK